MCGVFRCMDGRIVWVDDEARAGLFVVTLNKEVKIYSQLVPPGPPNHPTQPHPQTHHAPRLPQLVQPLVDPGLIPQNGRLLLRPHSCPSRSALLLLVVVVVVVVVV